MTHTFVSLTNRKWQEKNCRGSFHEACSSGRDYLPTWRPRGPLEAKDRRGGYMQSHHFVKYAEATGTVTPFDKYSESQSRLLRSHSREATVIQFCSICRGRTDCNAALTRRSRQFIYKSRKNYHLYFYLIIYHIQSVGFITMVDLEQ